MCSSDLLYCFREREILLELFEELCGARLTFSYARIGGVRQDVSTSFISKLQDFVDIFPDKIPEYETLIDTNHIPCWPSGCPAPAARPSAA